MKKPQEKKLGTALATIVQGGTEKIFPQSRKTTVADQFFSATGDFLTLWDKFLARFCRRMAACTVRSVYVARLQRMD